MMQILKEYYFHDKLIKNICINSNKDFMDEVIIDLFDEKEHLVKLKFIDCVFCNINGNGWIAGMDSIQECIVKKGEELENLIPAFVKEEDRKQFKYIRLDFNTSASNIEILAREILLLEEGKSNINGTDFRII
ncbi:MAG: hypothetical protein NC089_03070 [Bacteroides sp.]|nr:hypothetical protein [Bacteroides sp.]MCM1549525.1 hypothetical protein [Clostridium sp.]